VDRLIVTFLEHPIDSKIFCENPRRNVEIVHNNASVANVALNRVLKTLGRFDEKVVKGLAAAHRV
jgi:hypothetical protein